MKFSNKQTTYFANIVTEWEKDKLTWCKIKIEPLLPVKAPCCSRGKLICDYSVILCIANEFEALFDVCVGLNDYKHRMVEKSIKEFKSKVNFMEISIKLVNEFMVDVNEDWNDEPSPMVK